MSRSYGNTGCVGTAVVVAICLIATAALARVAESAGRRPKILWKFVAEGGVYGLGVGPDSTIYAGSYDSNIYALDPKSGALKWRFSTGIRGWGKDPVHALAVSNNGVIYAG